jgi:hypothetical protein
MVGYTDVFCLHMITMLPEVVGSFTYLLLYITRKLRNKLNLVLIYPYSRY